MACNDWIVNNYAAHIWLYESCLYLLRENKYFFVSTNHVQSLWQHQWENPIHKSHSLDEHSSNQVDLDTQSTNRWTKNSFQISIQRKVMKIHMKNLHQHSSYLNVLLRIRLYLTPFLFMPTQFWCYHIRSCSTTEY